MTSLRIGPTTWLLAPRPETGLRPAKRPVLAMFGRTLALAAATVALGFTTFATAPRADQSDAAPPTDEQVRFASPGLPNPAPPDAVAVSLFQATPIGADSRFTSVPPGHRAEGFVPPAHPHSEWREEEFASVGVVDGGTLAADGVRIHLVGVDLPLPEQVCRTLDGRLELCAMRAATQLELLTRWKRVTCHYRLESSGEAIGRCRTGTSDLADRMIKTGYTWRSASSAERG
jgi:endonuclease YncB( thermonuclease family)